MKHTEIIHHHHTRKRIFEKLEKYPSKDKLKKLFDDLVYFVGIMGPLMTIPQITKIWLEKDASGVSALSWFSYLITAIIWLFYGIIHQEKPIILTNTLWIILDIIIVTGTVIY